MTAERYDVVVGNIGNVYSGSSQDDANAQYESYATDSREGYGRAGGEDVTLLADGEPVREHHGRIRDVG